MDLWGFPPGGWQNRQPGAPLWPGLCLGEGKKDGSPSLPVFRETGHDKDLRLQDLLAGLPVHFLAVTLGKLRNFFNHGSHGSGAAFSLLERDRVSKSTYSCKQKQSLTVSLL